MNIIFLVSLDASDELLPFICLHVCASHISSGLAGVRILSLIRSRLAWLGMEIVTISVDTQTRTATHETAFSNDSLLSLSQVARNWMRKKGGEFPVAMQRDDPFRVSLKTDL